MKLIEPNDSRSWRNSCILEPSFDEAWESCADWAIVADLWNRACSIGSPLRENATMSRERIDVLRDNLEAIRRRIAHACATAGRDPGEVTLVAVTKYAALEDIRLLYELGVRDFGESRPQSLWERHSQLPFDARWHMIGRFQTNKVRRTLPLVSFVHSVDRWSLAETISALAAERAQQLPVTIQVNLTGEETKAGFSTDEIRQEFERLAALPGLDVVGLMTMARHEEKVERCRPTFAALRQLRDELSERHPLPVLSMGMSNDFEIAIEEGATVARVGSALLEGVGS